MPTNSRQTTRKTLTAAEIKTRSAKKQRDREIKVIEPDDLLSASMEKLCLALSHLDAHQLSTAKASELISVIKQLFEITQVLQGKPTTISATSNRKALKDLIPAVLKEAERRGLTMPGKVIEGEATRVEAPVEEGTRHTPGGAFESGTIEPSEQSEFSKILSSF